MQNRENNLFLDLKYQILESILLHTNINLALARQTTESLSPYLSVTYKGHSPKMPVLRQIEKTIKSEYPFVLEEELGLSPIESGRVMNIIKTSLLDYTKQKKGGELTVKDKNRHRNESLNKNPRLQNLTSLSGFIGGFF